MVTAGAADSHIATAEFLQVADHEVEDFEGGLPRGELAAVAGDLAQPGVHRLGVDIRTDGWDIRGRWFGVVAATPRLGELRRGQTIPWRVIAAQLAPRERRGPHRPDGARP